MQRMQSEVEAAYSPDHPEDLDPREGWELEKHYMIHRILGRMAKL
jgi:hypothetical protein